MHLVQIRIYHSIYSLTIQNFIMYSIECLCFSEHNFFPTTLANILDVCNRHKSRRSFQSICCVVWGWTRSTSSIMGRYQHSWHSTMTYKKELKFQDRFRSLRFSRIMMVEASFMLAGSWRLGGHGGRNGKIERERGGTEAELLYLCKHLINMYGGHRFKGNLLLQIRRSRFFPAPYLTTAIFF